MSYIRKYKNTIKKILSNTGIDNPFKSIFKEIEFETISFCNRKCDYCPNANSERMGDQDSFLMKDETFYTLISQLKDINYSGLIAPHLYGEPMADVRLARFCNHIKQELPSSKLKIVTNADYLNERSFQDLIDAGVDVFYISKHSSMLKKPARELLGKLNQEIRSKKIVINDFWEDFNGDQVMLNNRGGEIKLKKLKQPPVSCSYVTYPVINSFGDLVLCCQDYNSDYIFGNINKNHIRDLWFDKKNIDIRQKIYRNNFDLEICKSCEMY